MTGTHADSRSGPTVVCFDWGGVILRICRSWAEGCARAGVPMREEAVTPESMALRKAAAHDYQVGAITRDEFLATISRATGHAYSPAEVKLVHDAWLIEEYAGVAALVERLHATPGLRTALLSNTNACHWARGGDGVGRDYPTAGRLQLRHASHLLRLAKPDAAIYRAFEREVASALGSAPAQIVFFDDLAENIASAQACGWRAVQVDHTGDTAAQMTRALESLGIF